MSRPRREFLRPVAPDLPGEWTDRLSEVLESRSDIVRAYWVAERHWDDDGKPTVHEVLHLELEDPHAEGSAPRELFRELASVLPWRPGGLALAIPPLSVLPRVQEVGLRIWERPS